MEKWPNFFIVGAAKAGTTSLYSHLSQTRGVFMSPVKEPRYFNSNLPESQGGRNTTLRIRDKKKYLKLFQDVENEKAIGEASHTYLTDPESPKLIHENVPDSHIVIILRDPIERAFSQYLMRKSNGQEKRTFHKLIDETINKRKQGIKEFDICLDRGLYYEQVKRYIDTFGKNKVKVLIFEEFIKEPRKTVNEVLEFLNVDSEAPEQIPEADKNPYGVPRNKASQIIMQSNSLWELSRKIIPQSIRWKLKQNLLVKHEKKPEISKDGRLILEKFYRSDVEKLQELLHRKLPWSFIN